MYRHLVSICFLLLYASLSNTTVQVRLDRLNESKTKLAITIPVSEGDCIYHDYCDLTVDHPSITITNWSIDREPSSHYDRTFGTNKKLYTQDITITCQLTTDDPHISDAHVRCAYYLRSQKNIQEELIPVRFNQPAQQRLQEAIDVNQSEVIATAEQPPTVESKTQENWTCSLSTLIETTNSLWIRLILVLLLGLLMSLTPCIYPMVPITVGILQSQARKSLGQNFLLALSYTLGIATTFALLGLLAAFTGQMFGTILANPIFVLTVVAVLCYLAFSMLGFYDMYIPKIFQNSSGNKVKGGSFVSAFLFGAASGSVASPCLSPGLILLLSIVTTLGSKLMGFVLLFTFGIGLSLPLLVIGTFSSSLTMLPQAGMWMVEVKKFFGIMLIGMCFYFLNNIVPWHILMLLITISTALGGIWYLSEVKRSHGITKLFKNIIGTAMIAGAVYLGTLTYKAFNAPSQCLMSNHEWITDYQCAREQARARHQALLIKFGTQCCTICKAIDKKHFHSPLLKETLENLTLVRFDAANSSDSDMMRLKEKFNIFGVPAILLLDPEDEELYARWASELYDLSPTGFKDAIEKALLEDNE